MDEMNDRQAVTGDAQPMNSMQDFDLLVSIEEINQCQTTQKEPSAYDATWDAGLELVNYILPGAEDPALIAEELKKTGNKLKLRGEWNEAGDAFFKAANYFAIQGGTYEQADCYQTAADCYRKVQHANAILCLEHVAKLYCEAGQFIIAARLLESAGELTDRMKRPLPSTSAEKSDNADEFDDFVMIDGVNNFPEAVEFYRKAADFFASEGSVANAASCLTKAAIWLGDRHRYAEAAHEFEKLGVAAQGHDLLEFGANDHMFKSCLCLASDRILQQSCAEKADDLAKKCSLFVGSDELELIKSLAEATESGSLDVFDAAVVKYRRFNNLDDFDERRIGEARLVIASAKLNLVCDSGDLLT